eukprot:2725772-Prymnesium_polylepis.1
MPARMGPQARSRTWDAQERRLGEGRRLLSYRALCRIFLRKFIDTNRLAGRHGAPSGQAGTCPLAAG